MGMRERGRGNNVGPEAAGRRSINEVKTMNTSRRLKLCLKIRGERAWLRSRKTLKI